MLDVIDLHFNVWKQLIKLTEYEQRAYMALFFSRKPYASTTIEMHIKEIQRVAEIPDVSDVYAALRNLQKLGFIRKCDAPYGVHRYEFLMYTEKGENDET